MAFADIAQIALTPKWILWSLFAYFVAPLTISVLLPLFLRRNLPPPRKDVSIFVLGDLGHSPRMCYHALSFSRIGYAVNLCGYVETEPPTAVMDDVNIDIMPIKVIHNTMGLPYMAFAATKVFRQLWHLFDLLLQLRGCKYFMLQNPPSLPLLALLVVFIKLFSPRSRLIIDWHNLNYSILALKFPQSHPVVRLMRYYERFFSRFAWLNLTVTDQMRTFLSEEFAVEPSKILTLRDRPGPQFQPFEKTGLNKKDILHQHEVFSDIPNIEQYKIVVSATSFTPDEDFGILLDALHIYHESPEHKEPLFVIVTGKGPLKNQFLNRVEELDFSDKVIVRNAWLLPEEYPLILSMADLAVSLHTSSSGIDLPMKIVDFFGVGVPVVTLSFPAIGELVKDNYNGLVTTNIGGELSYEVYLLMSRALGHEEVYRKLKAGAMEESEKRWTENWNRVMADVVDT